ncbi:MAG: phosphate/phosphite/phosphonate ABC transporter substrate-binding protein [Nitrospiraceae bacterium]|nr:phosphate/phosphite/phosphonate ABC transporter substrate-binding protein [Nitrospiraceae bacterium]
MINAVGSRLIRALIIVFVLLAAQGLSSAEVKLGILPRLGAVELNAMFRPLAEYLSKETGEQVTLVVPKDFDTFKAMVKAGQVELGFANSLIYVQLKKDAAIEPLALSAEKKGGTKFRGVIIARKDSGIDKIQQLKGKKLIFVEKDSAAGYIFQMLLLSKAGLDVNKDFIKLPFAKKHDNVTMAVFNRSADAGGIREDDLEKMKDKVDVNQLKIVSYTDYFPNWPVFATNKLNKATAEKVRAALLKLKHGEAATEKVLGSAKLTAFSPVSDRDYDHLRQAARLAGAL